MIGNAIYNGAFALGGFLPVIPGPCGLYQLGCAQENGGGIPVDRAEDLACV